MHLLIIRPGAIGDTLLTFPVLRALRTQYSNPHITLLSNAAVLPLALDFGIVDEVSDYGHPQWSELFSTPHQGTRKGCPYHTLRDLLHRTDLAICWLRDPDGIVEQNMLRAGVKQVIMAPGRPPADSHVHVVEYLAETIGVGLDIGQLYSQTQGDRKVRLGEGHPGEAQYVAIHPGSGGASKCWPVPNFASIIEQLWQRNQHILLLGGPADHERLNDLLSRLESPPTQDMLKVLVDAPLLQVAHELQHCKGYLGNDSGITHLSAMLGIPTISLFGPTDPQIWRPLGPAVKVLQAEQWELLTPDMVVTEWEYLPLKP